MGGGAGADLLPWLPYDFLTIGLSPVTCACDAGVFAACMDTLVGVLEVDNMVMHFLRPKQKKSKLMKKSRIFAIAMRHD